MDLSYILYLLIFGVVLFVMTFGPIILQIVKNKNVHIKIWHFFEYNSTKKDDSNNNG